jgi:hypothetical protein
MTTVVFGSNSMSNLFKDKNFMNELNDLVGSKPKSQKVRFQESSSSSLMDDLFKTALRFALRQQKSSNRPKIEFDSSTQKISIGIDIVCYGAYNAKMAYCLTDESKSEDQEEPELIKIETLEDHIGNLKSSSDYTEIELDFLEQFQSMMHKCFHCFGKRWFELNEEEKRFNSNFKFKLIEVDQFPHLQFLDDNLNRHFSMSEILCKFFRTMLKCVNNEMEVFDENLKKLCVTLPSDFHSYQRLALKECFDHIGLKNFIMVNKSTSLALPFLQRDLSDSTKKFIIDFGSGKFLNKGSFFFGDKWSKIFIDFNN